MCTFGGQIVIEGHSGLLHVCIQSNTVFMSPFFLFWNTVYADCIQSHYPLSFNILSSRGNTNLSKNLNSFKLHYDICIIFHSLQYHKFTQFNCLGLITYAKLAIAPLYIRFMITIVLTYGLNSFNAMECYAWTLSVDK